MLIFSKYYRGTAYLSHPPKPSLVFMSMSTLYCLKFGASNTSRTCGNEVLQAIVLKLFFKDSIVSTFFGKKTNF